MDKVLLVLLYVIPLAATCFMGLLLWRKKADGDKAHMAFVMLIALLTALILIDTNKLSKFRLTMAGKDYRLSNVEVEEAFKANIGNILRVYNEYLVVETFDFSRPSDKWRIDTYDGKAAIFLKLKYEPLEKTMSFVANNGYVMIQGNAIKNGFYIVPILGTEETADKVRQDYAVNKTSWEVRYIRKP